MSTMTINGGIEPLPHDQAGYFDFSTDLAQEVRQDMVDALEAFFLEGNSHSSRCPTLGFVSLPKAD